jgi:hypothetical protein
MSAEPVQLVYDLSRRQRLATHLGIWLAHWPGFVLVLAIPVIVVILAVLKSPWFLLVLLLPPMFNNLPRFVGGLANALLVSTRRMDVVVEPQRLGHLFGQERRWIPLEEVTRVARFADVWVILTTDSVVDIPASLIDEAYLAHVRAMSREGREASTRRAADPSG